MMKNQCPRNTINGAFDSDHFLLFYVCLWFTQQQNTRATMDRTKSGIPVSMWSTAAPRFERPGFGPDGAAMDKQN